MKGLRQYLKKHGKHFTEELVKDVIPIKWDSYRIMKHIQNEVWYNCWSATEGDILYMVNVASAVFDEKANFKECLRFMLNAVGNYDNKDLFFDSWLEEPNVDDLTKYV